MPINDGNFREGNRAASLKPEIKAVRLATKEMLFENFSKYSKLTLLENDNIDKSNMSLLELGIIRSLYNFYESGNYDHIKYMLDQIIGRARESIELSSESNEKIEIIFTEKKA